MKIAVIGATGMIGSRIVAEAAARGHEVTAASRSGKPVEGVPAATALSADLADGAAVAKMAAASDVVVLAAGPSRTGGDHGQWLAALETALANVGDARVVVVGGAGALLVNGSRLVDLPGFPDVYKPEAVTMAAAYDLVAALPESVNWTMQAPAPEIGPGERTGTYVTALDAPAGDHISAEDFAVAVLDEIEKPRYVRARYGVAN
ncbi:NAD(P)-dependent oxidoreductase [Specibacter cremeus]|uniref:NAD(P)-dependent oxidoreductase n=1 Tax=Specibacter cremeus TaxID=1629051 RepID=UPI000F7885D4|nr:NAD(P)H-binding protein [Specibacter cremeus]